MPRLVTLILIVLFAGCAKSPERAALDKANAFLDQGHVQAARDTVEHYLRQHPDSALLLRMRVVVLLRGAQLDQAALAMQQVPDGRIDRRRDPAPPRPGCSRGRGQAHLRSPRVQTISTNSSALWTIPTFGCGATVRMPWVKLGNPAALKPLFRLLTDDNWFVRAEAAAALGKLGDIRAVGWLVQLLADPDGNVRYSATRALYELATEPARPLLLRALELAAPAQQFDIAVALARIHDPAALKPLADAVQSKDPEVRRLAARSLGECGLTEGTNALTVLLGDTDPTVREQAQAAIGQIAKGEKK